MTIFLVLWYITWIASVWGDVMRGWVRGIYHAMYWESVSKPCLALGPNCLGLKRCIGQASQLHLALSYSTTYVVTLDLLHALSGSMIDFGICWMRPNCRATRSGMYGSVLSKNEIPPWNRLCANWGFAKSRSPYGVNITYKIKNIRLYRLTEEQSM